MSITKIQKEKGEIIVNDYSIINHTLYKIFKTLSGEEIILAGYNLGGRIKIVKWLSDKKLILKVSFCKVLCGARGCGMVFDFPTKYYLGLIEDEKIPKDWNAWDGYIHFTHEMECGRYWREGLKILETLNT